MLLHRFDGMNPFEQRMQEADFLYLENSRAAQTTIAENYIGLPF